MFHQQPDLSTAEGMRAGSHCETRKIPRILLSQEDKGTESSGFPRTYARISTLRANALEQRKHVTPPGGVLATAGYGSIVLPLNVA
jgi:hypothetical protein